MKLEQYWWNLNWNKWFSFIRIKSLWNVMRFVWNVCHRLLLSLCCCHQCYILYYLKFFFLLNHYYMQDRRWEIYPQSTDIIHTQWRYYPESIWMSKKRKKFWNNLHQQSMLIDSIVGQLCDWNISIMILVIWQSEFEFELWEIHWKRYKMIL